MKKIIVLFIAFIALVIAVPVVQADDDDTTQQIMDGMKKIGDSATCTIRCNSEEKICLASCKGQPGYCGAQCIQNWTDCSNSCQQ